MSPLHNFDADGFLKDHWQQSPILVRQALPNASTLISADELAGLALEPEIESRLIECINNQWQVSQGPFSETDFANLPKTPWTLLVQAVDHWVPEIRDLMKSFRFLPSWRVDDVMISFSTPEGGVGPHFDHYDVFLIQLDGEREWQIGQQCDETTELEPNLPVKVMKDFQTTEKWTLSPGDMLYVPPGVAHWGTSITAGLTLSLGFRAPSVSETLAELGHFLDDDQGEFQRYQDPGLTNRSQSPNRISKEDVNRLASLLRSVADQPDLLEQWFGKYMTEPKYIDQTVETEDLSLTEFKKTWCQQPLVRNASSRIAYGQSRLYYDGEIEDLNLSESQCEWLCDSEVLYFEDASASAEAITPLMHRLFRAGVVFFESED